MNTKAPHDKKNTQKQSPVRKEPDQPKEGTTKDPTRRLLLRGVDNIRQHTTKMAAQAKHQLLIFSPVLDRAVYNNYELAFQISSNILRFPHLHIKILICHPKIASSKSHELLDLAQRLDSYIDVRRVHNDYIKTLCDYVVADESGYILRPNAEKYVAEASYHSSAKAFDLTKKFMKIWEQSDQDQESMQVYI